MFHVRQQQIVVTMENHRYIPVATEVTLRTVKTYDEAIKLVYTSYADSPAESHYAVISYGGKFIRAVKIGHLDGFRKPGVLQ